MAEEPKFDGGAPSDRARVLELLHAYLDANATFDWVTLQTIWSHDPARVFFNMNGHTYVGLEHWTRLWRYYSERMQSGRWEPFDITVTMRGDMALVTCHRRTRTKWTAAPGERPAGHSDKESFVSRSTIVMVKEAGDWKTVHVHFSEANAGARPGSI